MLYSREIERGRRGRDKSYLGGLPIDWDSVVILNVETSSYAGEIQDLFLGFDTSRCLKITLSGLSFGNGNIATETRIRNDNSGVVEHAHSINSVANERRLGGFLESNRGAWGRIPG